MKLQYNLLPPIILPNVQIFWTLLKTLFSEKLETLDISRNEFFNLYLNVQILILGYLFPALTAELLETLNITTYHNARKILSKQCSNGFFEKYYSSKIKKTFFILTRNGFSELTSFLKYNAKYRKPMKRTISHNYFMILNSTYLVILLLQELESPNIDFYQEVPLTDISSNLRADAMVNFYFQGQKKTLFLEQDMGTESIRVLYQKILIYTKIFGNQYLNYSLVFILYNRTFYTKKKVLPKELSPSIIKKLLQDMELFQLKDLEELIQYYESCELSHESNLDEIKLKLGISYSLIEYFSQVQQETTYEFLTKYYKKLLEGREKLIQQNFNAAAYEYAKKRYYDICSYFSKKYQEERISSSFSPSIIGLLSGFSIRVIPDSLISYNIENLFLGFQKSYQKRQQQILKKLLKKFDLTLLITTGQYRYIDIPILQGYNVKLQFQYGICKEELKKTIPLIVETISNDLSSFIRCLSYLKEYPNGYKNYKLLLIVESISDAIYFSSFFQTKFSALFLLKQIFTKAENLKNSIFLVENEVPIFELDLIKKYLYKIG